MLNPPLSLLSDDLLSYIVEHAATLLFHTKDLCNLSLADRAFTQLCQAYLFRTFQLGGGSGSLHAVSMKLERLEKILDKKPSISNRVRVVELVIAHKKNLWLFKDSTFLSILQRLAKSPIPPYELHFGGVMYGQLIIQDPVLVVKRLVQSFFSQSLTVLHLTECKNVPLPLFLVCSRLSEVLLDRVAGKEKTYDIFPETLCSGRELPVLEVFDYRESQSVVKQMINPPPRFRSGVVLWSNLRILTLSPHEKEEMACLQHILDAACNTLEELYLTSLRVGNHDQLALADLVNLCSLSQLRVFALYAIIECEQPESTVLHDIITVLGRVPASNKVTNLSFDFTILGIYPFRGCLDEDWVGICDEVIRISAGKPLEFDLMTTVSTGKLQSRHHGEDKLYEDIIKLVASLSEYSKICIHFWNPTCWTQGLGSYPRGQVRGCCWR